MSRGDRARVGGGGRIRRSNGSSGQGANCARRPGRGPDGQRRPSIDLGGPRRPRATRVGRCKTEAELPRGLRLPPPQPTTPLRAGAGGADIVGEATTIGVVGDGVLSGTAPSVPRPVLDDGRT